MATPKTDRRAQRSRELLLDAFRLLLTQRSYTRITIQNVLDQAGVGRATFYAHFQNKDDLLTCSTQRLRDGLFAIWKAQIDADPRCAGRLAFVLPLLHHFDSHRNIYHLSTAPRHGDTRIHRNMQRAVESLVREDLLIRPRSIEVGAALDLIATATVATLWSLTVSWIETGHASNAQDIHHLFEQLVFPGLDATLGAPPTHDR